MDIKLFLNQLQQVHVSDSVLYDFVTAQTNGVHVKDAKTGAYILGNGNTLKIFGLSKFEKFIGLNVFEIDEFMRPYWGKNYAKNIDEIDTKALTTKKLNLKQDIVLLNADNKIYVHDLVKVPLLGADNKPVALLTTVLDRTKNLDLFYLFNLYLKLAPSKSKGVSSFMRFLGVDRFFYEELTYKEALCLLCMRLNQNYRSVAQKLNISIKTVESHVSHIISKLKEGRLAIVLTYLRENQSHPGNISLERSHSLLR